MFPITLCGCRFFFLLLFQIKWKICDELHIATDAKQKQKIQNTTERLMRICITSTMTASENKTKNGCALIVSTFFFFNFFSRKEKSKSIM